jgi:hypothetical protein
MRRERIAVMLVAKQVRKLTAKQKAELYAI